MRWATDGHGPSGRAVPGVITSHELPLGQTPRAYEQFDRRVDGWTKVFLHPRAA